MKYVIMVALAFAVSSCAKDSGKDGSAVDGEGGNTTESLAPQVITPPSGDLPPASSNQLNVPAGSDGKLWHFICADGCTGGHGDAQGPCPVCGKELAHNQAYHNNPQTAAPTDPINPQVNIQPDNQPMVPNANQVTVPAGPDGKVWHFVCADKCKGGVGDSKANCPVCGKEMAHNQAYHK